MGILVKFEMHAYSGEKLRDEYFDEPYGLHGKDVMYPLSQKKDTVISIDYDELTTIGEFFDRVADYLEGDNPMIKYRQWIKGFIVDGESLHVDYERAYIIRFVDILHKYLDTKHRGIVIVYVLVNCNAGAVFKDHGLRFDMHSHEKGRHNEPHVHVEDTAHRYKASLRLSDGEIIAGNLSSKLHKEAIKIIQDNRAYFYECWHKKTDGLIPGINKHFGYLPY